MGRHGVRSAIDAKGERCVVCTSDGQRGPGIDEGNGCECAQFKSRSSDIRADRGHPDALRHPACKERTNAAHFQLRGTFHTHGSARLEEGHFHPRVAHIDDQFHAGWWCI